MTSLPETTTAARGGPTGDRRAQIAWSVFRYAVCVALAFGVASLLVIVAGASPAVFFRSLYWGGIGDWPALGRALDKAAPLLLVALGMNIVTRGGQFNIGQEGQVILGAVFATVPALFLPGPGWIALVVALAAGALGGFLWAGIPSLLFYRTGVPVVVSTLLLASVATQVLSLVVTSPSLLQEQGTSASVLSPQSDRIRESAWLPRIGDPAGFSISLGVVFALVAAFVVYLVLNRTAWGFKLRLVGMNPFTAKASGVHEKWAGGLALAISGAFAGFAGAILLTGSSHRLQPGVSENSGWDGLLVALVARQQPLVAIPVAFFFGVLRSSGGTLAASGVPRYIVDVVMGVIVFAIVFPRAYAEWLRKRTGRRPARV